MLSISHWALLSLVLLLSSCAGGGHTGASFDDDGRPQSLILLIADGTGPASFTLARDFVRHRYGRRTLAVDAMLVGSASTAAANTHVTDSAAGATAFATGHKTNNGAIAVDTAGRPLGTILESAQRSGMATGLVATSRITHATPAAFSSHVRHRGMEEEIARQQIAKKVDLVLGGGREFFLPIEQGGKRTDGSDLTEIAGRQGYAVVSDRVGFDALSSLPALGLLSTGHMAYEIDRDPSMEPSLAEMTEKAISLLSQDPDGFFLLIEASRIDHAAHGNDPAAHLYDILAFDDAVGVAAAYAQRHGRTLVVATSDHETGGLGIGQQVGGVITYAWRPGILANVSGSSELMRQMVVDGQMTSLEALSSFAGIDSLDAAEQKLLANAGAADEIGRALCMVINRRAQIGWTTHGHTAVDVNVYALGPGKAAFAGYQENHEVGRKMAALLALDLREVPAGLSSRVPD